jgi:hypothetical protein
LLIGSDQAFEIAKNGEVAASSAAAIEARWEVEVARAEYRDAYGAEPPEIDVSAILTRVDAEDARFYAGVDRITEYGAELSLTFDRLSISFGATTAPDEDTHYATLGVTYSPDNRDRERYDRAALTAAIELASAAYAEALLDTEASVIAEATTIVETVSGIEQAQYQLSVARRALDEALAAAERGLRSDADLRDAAWEVERWEYELALLIYAARESELRIEYIFGGNVWM